MRDTHPLLDALNDLAPGKLVANAIRESRRMRSARRCRNAGLVALACAAIASAVMKFESSPVSNPAPAQAFAQPALRIFSTADAASSLPAFSTPKTTRALAFFSSKGEPLAIRSIDDYALLELLQPYGPVIVYAGPGEQPSLLLLNRHP